jgi:uncharacterized RDD family membrane protein YckC
MERLSFPSITRRYLSSLVDGLFIFAMLILAGYLFQNNSELTKSVRISLVLLLFLVYEPFCTSKFCTIGQKITGIRIRDYNSKTKLPLYRAYFRIIVKIFLGFISLLTIMFSKDRRAIHDFIARSIVLEKNNA